MDFDMFFWILIFEPKWGFCMTIAFAWWPIFKMLSFLEYLVFFKQFFWTQLVEMICRMDFNLFFGILVFYPKWGFCMGYSLCMMADFQNGLISRIFGVFSSGFLHRIFLMICRMDFDRFVRLLICDPRWGFCMGYSLCIMAKFSN